MRKKRGQHEKEGFSREKKGASTEAPDPLCCGFTGSEYVAPDSDDQPS